MKFIEILHEINLRRSPHRRGLPDQKTLSEYFLKDMQNLSETDQEIAKNLLEEIERNLTVDNTKTHSDQGKAVENFLLPIIRLAYIYEKKGISEEHAAKLGSIFSKVDDALNYLDKFSQDAIKKEQQKSEKEKRTPGNVPSIYNACLFDLPPTEAHFNFKHQKWQGLIKAHMQDPEFRELLASAPEIEKFISKHSFLSRDPNKQPVAEEKLREAENAVQKINKEYKEILRKRIQGKTLTETEEAFVKHYGNNLLEAQLKLVEISAALGRKFDKLSVVELKAYSAKYKSVSTVEFKYFLDHGLTKNDYAKFVQLDKIDNDKAIPPIVIDGQTIGHPGYYLRRLNVANPADATLAACLGKLTDCCQSLSGGFGEACTIHGLTSPDGGFYVVCQGDVHNPKPLEDSVVYQSWVWRSKSEAIVIDSVEPSKTRYSNIAKAFYSELAYKLVKEHQVPKVTCGMERSAELRIDPSYTPSSRETPKDYNGYRDSHTQFIVCETDALYLLPGRETEFFEQCEGQKLSADHPIYIKMLDFAIKGDINSSPYKKNLLRTYRTTDPVRQQIIYRCFVYLRAYKEKNYSLMTSMSSETPYLLGINDEGESNLLHHLAARHPEFLRKTLALYSEQDRLTAIKKQNQEGDSVLHLLVQNPESLRQVLTLCPNPNWLEAVTERNQAGNSVLHLAAQYPESLKELLTRIPAQDLLKAVTERNQAGNSILHLAAQYPESLKELLTRIPAQDLLKAITERNQAGNSVLHLAAQYPESLKELLTHIPAQDLLKAVTERTNDGKSLLYFAAQHPESLDKILAIYPEEIRSEAVKERDYKDNTVLHFSVKNPESLKKILSFYSKENRLEAINARDSNGDSVLHLVAKHPESLKQLLELIPEEERLALIKQQTQDGKNVLSWAIKQPKLFEQILMLIPEESRLEAVKGTNLLRLATLYPESLGTILSLYPEESRLLAVKEKDAADGYSVLSFAIEDPESLKKILALIPKYISSIVQDAAEGDPKKILKLLESFEETQLMPAERNTDTKDQGEQRIKSPKSLQWQFQQGSADKNPDKKQEIGPNDTQRPPSIL